MTETHSGRSAVFVSLSNRAVYRNLFFFPGGFWERLKEEARRRGFRIVVLVTPKDGEKYRARLGEGEGTLYAFETVKVPYPKRLGGKLFYFFYSYLVYTGTTRLLATMGTRPDEPPAGGRRSLAPVKWALARTFGRSRFLKRRVVPALFLHIFRERPFADLFDRHRPALVFSANLYGWFDQLLVAEAKRLGVRTRGMVANWDHLDKYFLAMRLDRLFVQSPEMRSAAMRYQAYEGRELAETGYPHFDFIVDRSFAAPREEVLAKLRFPADARYVLYASGSAYCPDEPDIIEEVLHSIERGEFGENVFLVIRPYVGGRFRDREFDEAKYRRFESHPLVRFYSQDFWDKFEDGVYFMNVLRHASAVLSIFSTIALEAAVLDRPILAIDFDGHRTRPFHRSIRRFALFEHFRHVRATGAMPIARSFGDLTRLLREALAEPGKLGSERERLRREFAGPLDARSSERLVRGLVEALPPRS